MDVLTENKKVAKALIIIDYKSEQRQTHCVNNAKMTHHTSSSAYCIKVNRYTDAKQEWYFEMYDILMKVS